MAVNVCGGGGGGGGGGDGRSKGLCIDRFSRSLRHISPTHVLRLWRYTERRWLDFLAFKGVNRAVLTFQRGVMD